MVLNFDLLSFQPLLSNILDEILQLMYGSITYKTQQHCPPSATDDLLSNLTVSMKDSQRTASPSGLNTHFSLPLVGGFLQTNTDS